MIHIQCDDVEVYWSRCQKTCHQLCIVSTIITLNSELCRNGGTSNFVPGNRSMLE